MNSHLQSIIDCIEQIRLEGTENHSLEADDDYTVGFNDALQAVLSKIEGLSGKSKSFFEIDISLENPKIPEEQMEAFNIAMNMRTVFDQYNIDHSKLALFPDGVNDGEIVTGKIAGINVAYPRAK